jgi:hypothetical protein
MTERVNEDVAGRLEELARLVGAEAGGRFRARAYERAAQNVRVWPQSMSDILRDRGTDGLRAVPGVGPGIARAIRDLLVHGRLAMLERLRGESEPTRLLQTVPGIGRELADRAYHELGIATLEDLEAAAHDGRLEQVLGFGAKRLAGIRDSLAHRLQRLRPPASTDGDQPSVDELLDVDREYREKADARALPLIAPRRFNPLHDSWLPVLHTTRGARRYTALFSNTALAHRLGRTHDWVVIYWDSGSGQRQCTVVTALRGPLAGERVVRGRETARPSGRPAPPSDSARTSPQPVPRPAPARQAPRTGALPPAQSPA